MHYDASNHPLSLNSAPSLIAPTANRCGRSTRHPNARWWYDPSRSRRPYVRWITMPASAHPHHHQSTCSRGIRASGESATILKSGSKGNALAVSCRGGRNRPAKMEKPPAWGECAGVWGNTTPKTTDRCHIPRLI